MDNRSNLHSYDGVEMVQSSEFSLEDQYKYCMQKLESAKDDLNFIKEKIESGGVIEVCEIGSGNSKLLYALEKEGIISKATGYEVSESRWNMANRFGEILHSDKSKVVNINGNFLDDKPKDGAFDLVIMVDIVLQIIAPLYDDAEADTMKWLSNALDKGGYVLLEIEDYQGTINELKDCGGVLRKWEEYDESDPFQYGLHKIELDKDGNIVIDKTFIKRDLGGKDNFKNVIKSYSQELITKTLEKSGFAVEIYPYFEGNEETENIQNGMYKRTRFRVLAKKL